MLTYYKPVEAKPVSTNLTWLSFNLHILSQIFCTLFICFVHNGILLFGVLTKFYGRRRVLLHTGKNAAGYCGWCVVTCICNLAFLVAKFCKAVGSRPVGGNSPSITGVIV